MATLVVSPTANVRGTSHIYAKAPSGGNSSSGNPSSSDEFRRHCAMNFAEWFVGGACEEDRQLSDRFAPTP